MDHPHQAGSPLPTGGLGKHLWDQAQCLSERGLGLARWLDGPTVGKLLRGNLRWLEAQCGGGGGHAPLQGQVHLCSWPREGETLRASTPFLSCRQTHRHSPGPQTLGLAFLCCLWAPRLGWRRGVSACFLHGLVLRGFFPQMLSCCEVLSFGVLPLAPCRVSPWLN